MNENPSLILIGIGGAGCAIAHGVSRAFGESMRYALIDTDAASDRPGAPFCLIGGERLSGHGSGGDILQARLSAEDSLKSIGSTFEGARLAVVVASLGGGTGGGATLEIVKHLENCGISTIVFATLPFALEGDERQRRARGVMSMIEEEASAAVFTSLDKLVGDVDNMDLAMRLAIDTLASGVTLFWRLLEKPGYIRLDAERVRRIVAHAGRGRFATITVQGPDRAEAAVDALARAPLLAAASGPVGSILCGILAGEDLRLSEVGRIAEGVRDAFGRRAVFDLATVNDETTFTGRISVAVLLFETGDDAEDGDGKKPAAAGRRGRRGKNLLAQGPQGRGRFNNVEPTVWNGQDLDVPTFIRRNINLDF